jgi:hypothetical protein
MPQHLRPWIRSRRAQLGVAAALLVILMVVFTDARFHREAPPPRFDSAEDEFLFGSVGNEAADGVPYWVWLVLPRLFPDLLPGPGGYASLGIQSKDGYEMPIGFSKVTVGYPRVGINCAMCHAGGAGTQPDEAAARRYVNFLAATAADPRFTPSAILGEIAKNYRLSLADRLLYRLVIIPETERRLRASRQGEPLWDHDAVGRVPAVERAKNYIGGR